jgi:aminoglycoside phosphotransferase (APT) family kinase protein
VLLETIPVREDERFSVERVAEFLAVAGLPAEGLTVEQFPAGHSNLTYLLQAGEWQAVLRRPPLGPVAPRAHDMAREFHILARLHPAFPLAPEPYVLCEDTSPIGAPFYVMQRRRGLVLDTELPRTPRWQASPDLHHAIAESVVRVLVELHAVDWQAAGLGEMAHPEGYMQRQVRGWLQRYQRAATPNMAQVGDLAGWFESHLPASPPPTVVHNDYKLNNLLLDPSDPRRVAAVLDWEMATVGDPLSDLSSLMVYWTAPGEADLMGGLRSVTAEPGFPGREWLAERYAALSGRDLSSLTYYLAFSYFRLAVICQQIYFRYFNGQTHDERFAGHERVARNLVRKSAEVAAGGQS